MDDTVEDGRVRNLPTQPYLNMTRQELENQYTPSRWTRRNLTPDGVIDAHITSLQQGSEVAKKCVRFTLGMSYGNTAKQKLDIVDMDNLPKGCPILIYIHGGYWQQLGREMSTFMTLPIYEAGGAVVAIGYDLAPEVTLPQILDQIFNAVKRVLNLAIQRDSRGVYLFGHSAGGHLAAMMLGVDWKSEVSSSTSPIKGAALLSGIFDMRPLVNTPENNALKLDDQTAWRCSPFSRISGLVKNNKDADILVAVGRDESPEFIRQSKEYAKLLQIQGVRCDYVEVDGEDHFTLVEKTQNPDYILTKRILLLMKLIA